MCRKDNRLNRIINRIGALSMLTKEERTRQELERLLKEVREYAEKANRVADKT